MRNEESADRWLFIFDRKYLGDVLFVAGSNLTSGWTTPPGRFMTTVAEMGLSEVFGMAILFVVLGIVIMMVELFRRDKQ